MQPHTSLKSSQSPTRQMCTLHTGLPSPDQPVRPNSEWHQLLRAAKAGDPRAGDRIASLILSWTLRALQRNGQRDHEDIAGEFTAHMVRDGFRHIPSHRLIGHLQCGLQWFVIDWWRKSARRRKDELLFSELDPRVDINICSAPNSGNPEDAVLCHEEVRRIWNIVKALNWQNRLIISRWCTGSSYQELAEISGLKVSTVKQRLFSIRQQIRRRIAAMDG